MRIDDNDDSYSVMVAVCDVCQDDKLNKIFGKTLVYRCIAKCEICGKNTNEAYDLNKEKRPEQLSMKTRGLWLDCYYRTGMMSHSGLSIESLNEGIINLNSRKYKKIVIRR